MNIVLKKENDDLKKQLTESKNYHHNYIELKKKYRLLHESYQNNEQCQKETKDVILDQKKTIRTLKKKLSYYKERLKDKNERVDVIAPIADITRKQNAGNQIINQKMQAEGNMKLQEKNNSRGKTIVAVSKRDDRGRESQRKFAPH